MNGRPGIDPVILEVLRNRLETIADEMELTLLKSAASPIVKDGLDASAALFNIRGETIAQPVNRWLSTARRRSAQPPPQSPRGSQRR
jgi:N-methylhydantoinase B